MPRKKLVISKEERRAEESFATHQQLVENEKQIRALKIANIPLYVKLFETQGYKDILGDENAEWAAYLGDLEVYHTRAEVNRWLKIHQTLCHEYGLELEELFDTPSTRVGDIAYIAGGAEDARALLTQAKTLSASEWRREVHTRTGKHTPEDGHTHDMKKYSSCTICHKKERLDE